MASALAFQRTIREVDASFPEERIRRQLRRAGVDSWSDLAAAAEHSRRDAAAFYTWLLGRFRGAGVETVLLRILTGRRRSLWMQAAMSLSMSATPRVVPRLVRIVTHDEQPARREASVYALGALESGVRAPAIIRALTGVLQNPDEVSRVRAQAAESVTQLVRFRRGRVRAAAEAAIVEHLTDDSPDVRFWCAYAAGELRATAARPFLRQLVKDRAVPPGWWSVGTEARAALVVIAGGAWPDRVGRPVPRAESPAFARRASTSARRATADESAGKLARPDEPISQRRIDTP